jgi:hypothetical protein
MKPYRMLLSVEIVVDADDAAEARAKAQPLISAIGNLSVNDVDVNDVDRIVCEPLDEEDDWHLNPCGDPDCSCS